MLLTNLTCLLNNLVNLTMSSEQEFKCVFCSETFPQKEDLQIHFRKHGDPNFNHKKPKVRRQDETDVLAEMLKDQVEVVECDVCTEVFSTISKAITHKHKVHPDHDTKYFCPWCGKLFTMKHLYNKHMQASHLEMAESGERLFHCDSCDVDFNIPTAMAYHNKFYHRQEELPTLGHSKKLKLIQEEVVQIYYCPFCGEEYDNKVNLHKHMMDEHSGENQSPDDVFRCPLCEAIFYYLDAYELHLTYHSIEDLYTERNEMMNEITDFSLETVQPLQEKVEPLNEEQTGIEELLEFTMEDAPDQRKSKKHKKHKKSKKNAITLDEFLNMNKDVFGEGIDFQGIEEVPTQAVAKRLKPKKPVASKFMSSDLAKLKRQGIVVKKQPGKNWKPAGKQQINKEALKAAIKTQKNENPIPQTKINTLTSTDDVLSKLLNQGNQIKIVKKSNQDHEELVQEKEDNIEEEKLSQHNTETNNEDKTVSDVTETAEENIEDSRKNMENASPKINNVKLKSQGALPDPGSPSIIANNKDVKDLQNCNDVCTYSPKLNNDMEECPDESKNGADLTNNLNILQNNANIAVKLCKQNAFTTIVDNSANQENDDVGTTKKKELDNEKTNENTEYNATSVSEKPINALKHLSHLITIKSVNSTKTASLSDDSKSENSLQKIDLNKASNISQNNSPKRPESTHFSNLKNLSGITIKPTTQLSFNTSKNENDDEDHETDDEWNEDKSRNNKMDTDKVAHLLKSPQLNVQTKYFPKTIPKEPFIETPNNDSSQSSADLLKHLKNVTAKPVHINPQKILTPQSSPSSIKRSNIVKTSLQKEVTEDGIEIFSIDDSDSDEANCNKSTNNTIVKTESRIEPNKSIDALKNINKNITVKSNIQQCKTVYNDTERHSNKTSNDEEDDCGDDFGEKETLVNPPNTKFSSPKPNQKNIAINNVLKILSKNITVDDFDEKESLVNPPNTKFSSPKPNQKNIAINNVLKNLSRNITVKSRNSSPSQSVPSHDYISKDTHLETNEEGSDSDSPVSRVKITEMENMSDDEFSESHAETNISHGNVKVQHPDDSHSEHDDEPIDEDFDDMSDNESQIAATKMQTDNSKPSISMKNVRKDLTITSSNHKATDNSKSENSIPEEIPNFSKNLSNQISIKQIKKPDSKNAKVVEQTEARSTNQSSVNQKMASSSNQVNTFNKEVKTVKTFQTQTKTVIQEITTTVTKTIKTVNQTMKQEVRNIAQSSSAPISQKIQGMNTNFSQKSFHGVKVRQSAPNVRPKIRGQAPQTVRPAICAPPRSIRPAICTPVRASNQLVPFRPASNRPSGPRPRMPNVMNLRASTSGQQRPQIGRPVKISPGAVFASPKKPAETTGHFSCFKKPKESLIPVPDFAAMNQNDGESSAQFSSSVQMSKSNFSSTTKVVKGNSVVTSTQMKSEMSASSQQLSKLRGMSGLSVVKTSQNQAKQTQVEEKSEMTASKRNALEAIQKLQNQGLLIKKPRLEDVGEDSDHSQPGSDDIGHDSNDEFDE